MRSCIACRGARPRGELLRLVCDPQGKIYVDRDLRAPGRGAHLCYSARCLEAAIQRKAFNRAFQRNIQAFDLETLRGWVLEAIKARIFDALSLARRGQTALSGTDPLLRGMQKVKLLLLAEDGAQGSLDRLLRRARALEIPIYRYGEATLLGKSQGKGRRIAIGLIQSGVAERLKLEFQRRDRVLVAA